MKSVVEELAALRALDVDALALRYETLFGRPPRARHREHLFRKCAYRVQELRLGGLSGTARKRLDELSSQIELVPPVPAKHGLAPGAVISREWRGQNITVTVLDDGRFDYAGTPYRSLSAIAKVVTGANWNGPAWFGIRERTR